LGYRCAQPPDGVGELVAAAEDSGFDAVFAVEAWGSDAFTPLTWWGTRGPVTNDGPHYPLTYAGEGAVGLGKPLKSIVHPLRSDLPIWLGAEGPKNVALTAEIADGWIPIFYSPHPRACTSRGWTRASPASAPVVPGRRSRSPAPGVGGVPG